MAPHNPLPKTSFSQVWGPRTKLRSSRTELRSPRAELRSALIFVWFQKISKFFTRTVILSNYASFMQDGENLQSWNLKMCRTVDMTKPNIGRSTPTWLSQVGAAAPSLRLINASKILVPLKPSTGLPELLTSSSAEIKWDQKRSNEIKWDQMRSTKEWDQAFTLNVLWRDERRQSKKYKHYLSLRRERLTIKMQLWLTIKHYIWQFSKPRCRHGWSVITHKDWNKKN